MKLSEGSQTNWNRIATIIATIAMFFLFTRSAPFPAGTFWELSIARDFYKSIDGVFLPEVCALSIIEFSSSFFALKAIYHILFFLICSGLSIFVFRGKELTQGLVTLCVFALFMQAAFPLRQMLLILSVLISVFTLESKIKELYKGIILIFPTAVLTAMGLNSWIIFLFVLCYVIVDYKKYKPMLLFFVAAGIVLFPKGIEMCFDSSNLLNRCYFIKNDKNLLCVFACLFFLVNLIFIRRLVKYELEKLIFYFLIGVLSCFYFNYMPIFLFVGLMLLIKCFTKSEPLGLNVQLSGVMILTVIVHFYLFFHPIGLKLNPTVNKHIGKNLTPILDGYVSSLILENSDIGELVWKNIIRLNADKMSAFDRIKDWKLSRLPNGDFEIHPAVRNSIYNE